MGEQSDMTFNEMRAEHFELIRKDLEERVAGSGNNKDVTVSDYYEKVTGEELSNTDSKLEVDESALHIFTRFYPYENQDIAFVLTNPRLDTGDEFPTLEHYEYSLYNANWEDKVDETIQSLASISRRHYPPYFNSNINRRAILKRLAYLIDETDLYSNRDCMLSDIESWDSEDVGNRPSGELNRFCETRKVSDHWEGIENVNYEGSESEIISRYGEVELAYPHDGDQSTPDFFDDIYVTNVFKFGTPDSDSISNLNNKETDTVDVTRLHAQLTRQEVARLDPELIVLFGLEAQKPFIGDLELAYSPFTVKEQRCGRGRSDLNTISTNKLSNSGDDKFLTEGHPEKKFKPRTPGKDLFGRLWQCEIGDVEFYVLPMPHTGRFGSSLSSAQPSDLDVGETWEFLDCTVKKLSHKLQS